MKWTPEKIEALRRRYPHEDNGRLARELGCSRKALAFRASSLGLRKTEEANEARYAALSRRSAPEGMEGERRQIATGAVIVRGNVLTHLSNFSAARDQARGAVEEEGAVEDAQGRDDALPPFARGRGAAQPSGAHRHPPCGEKGAQGGYTPHGDATRHTLCPQCKTRFVVPAPAQSAYSLSQEN